MPAIAKMVGEDGTDYGCTPLGRVRNRFDLTALRRHPVPLRSSHWGAAPAQTRDH
jgi:hypothetical protein